MRRGSGDASGGRCREGWGRPARNAAAKFIRWGIREKTCRNSWGDALFSSATCGDNECLENTGDLFLFYFFLPLFWRVVTKRRKLLSHLYRSLCLSLFYFILFLCTLIAGVHSSSHLPLEIEKPVPHSLTVTNYK